MEIFTFNAFNAIQWKSYIADGAVALFVLIISIICAKKGFVGCLLGFLSTIIAVVAAVALAKPILEATDGAFGLQDVLQKAFEKAFGKIAGFNADISGQGIEAALESQDFPAILSKLVMKLMGKGDLAPGTTLAGVVSVATARLATTLIVGILIFIVIKLLVRLLRKILNAIIKSIPLVGGLNRLLGFLVGVIEALLIVSFVLAILALFPSQGVLNYFANSLFVGWLYDHNLLVMLLSLFI